MSISGQRPYRQMLARLRADIAGADVVVAQLPPPPPGTKIHRIDVIVRIVD